MNALKPASVVDAKIDALKPGQAVTISEGNGFRATAERSCDGNTLRIVREWADGFEVIRTSKW